MMRTKTEERWGIVLILFCMISISGVIPLYAQEDIFLQTLGPEGGSIKCIVVNAENEIFITIENDVAVYKSTDYGGSWIRLTDLSDDARAMCITTAGDVFVGTWYGVRRSKDKGLIWQEVDNGLTNLRIQSLAYNRTTQHLFAGTYEGGIFRSTDNGDNWQPVNTGIVNLASIGIIDILCPSAGNTIYAAGWKIGADGGVFRSSDNGDNWERINGNISSTDIRSVLALSTTEILAATYGGGVFKTVDGGTTWNPANNGLNSYKFFLKLIMGPSNTIYLGGMEKGLFSSVDGGDTWVSHSSMIIGRMVQAITYNSNNDDVYVGLGGSGIYRSTDNGTSWNKINNGLLHTSVADIAISSDNTVMYATVNDGGIFKSVDGGYNWFPINNGLTEATVNVIKIKDNLLFAGTYSSGVFKSTDYGDTWVQSSNGLGNQYIYHMLVASNGLIYAGTYGRVYSSSDNGANWTLVHNKVGTTVGAMAANETTGSLFFGFSSDSGIVRSNLSGTSWETVNNGLTVKSIMALAVSPDGNVWAVAYDTNWKFYLFFSNNNGNSWTEVDISTANFSYIFDLAINSAGQLFLATNPRNVCRSIDKGISWQLVTNYNIQSLIFDSNDYLLAGSTGDGVCKSVYSTLLPIPALSLPADSATAVTLTPTLSWNEVATANQYQLQVSLDNVFTGSLVEDVTIPTATSYQINTGLNGNTTYYWRVRAMIGNSYSSNWSTARQFTTVELPAAPALVSPSDGATGVTLHPTFSWTAVSGTYDLQISPNTGFTNLIVDQDGITTTSYTYQGEGLGFNTTYYWRLDVTSGGLTSLKSEIRWFVTEQYPTELYLTSTINYPSYASPDKYASTDYRIFGLPGNDYMLLGEFLGGKAGVNWQAYWDNGAANNYLVKYVGTDIFRMVTGRAFWVINNGPIVIDIHVTPASLNADYEAEIDLHTGWNLITNPFLLNVDWVAVQNENMISNPIIEYTGAIGLWQDRTVMQPFVGYYFYYGGNPIKLRIPYSARIGKPAVARPVIDWQVTIKTAAEGIEDHFTRFGVAESASNDLDELDFRKPRAIEDLAGACFYRPEWDQDYPVFATDIRKPITDSEVWEFKVNAIPQKTVKLTFTDLDQIPAVLAVYLVDKAYSRCIDLRNQVDYDFVAITKESQFEVVVGTESAIRDRLSTIIPHEYALGKNFPNPFNPVTTIPVSLPKDTRISLRIYNLLGQQISDLYNGTLPVGVHYFVWEGIDHYGLRLPSGVYLYRLSTDAGFNFTGKMVLVK
jgi:photosystem II stability/assembly factor-like uncharacterized protein